MQLNALGYKYASKTRFGPSVLPVPENMSAAKQQIKHHERELQISLLERKQAREKDIADAEEILSKPTHDDSHQQLTTDNEEHEVDREDVNKTKWVSTCCNAQYFSISTHVYLGNFVFKTEQTGST